MQVHAEHGEAVARAQQQVFDSGITGPEGHAISRPAVLEVWHAATYPAPLQTNVMHGMRYQADDVQPACCSSAWSPLLFGLWQAEATARAIRLAKFVGVPLYVVHVMAAEALEEVWIRLHIRMPLMWPK
jgi:dihydropyrimidinase